MNEERRAEYEALSEQFDDLPDGAYFAVMAEHGFEIEDIIALNTEELEDE